mmetsp:Transcript_29715/g.44070  ORF Transcript_29715/g.44070 Transcript_29715/m.44070 type:complete len:113 (+) Transcript_29715:103-441(+)
MLSAARFALTRTTNPGIAPRILTSTRFMSIGDDLKKKEKFEEEKYIREKEASMRKTEDPVTPAPAENNTEQSATHDADIHSAVEEVREILNKTGDNISPEGLFSVASWKVGN